jgi:hypothetical protein
VHLNAELWFLSHARALFTAGDRVLEVGLASVPSWFEQTALSCSWEYADIEPTARGGGSVTHVMPDEYTLPLADDAVDIVLSAQVIEHVRKPWVWMRDLGTGMPARRADRHAWSCELAIPRSADRLLARIPGRNACVARRRWSQSRTGSRRVARTTTDTTNVLRYRSRRSARAPVRTRSAPCRMADTSGARLDLCGNQADSRLMQ